MFGWTKRLWAKREPKEILRGVLPTSVSDTEFTLAKSSPSIRNSYEIRLGLYMAVKAQKRFILVVPPAAIVEPTISSLVQQNGGVIRQEVPTKFTVYVGHTLPGGEEGDGWVVGDQKTWLRVQQSASPQLRECLHVGKVFNSGELQELETLVQDWNAGESNIDHEPIGPALLALTRDARRLGGQIFIQ